MNINFDYDFFLKWYQTNSDYNTNIFGKIDNISQYFNYSSSKQRAIFQNPRKFIDLSNFLLVKYGTILTSEINNIFGPSSRPYKRFQEVFLSVNDKRVYIVFPRQDQYANSTGHVRIWGDHFTILKDRNNNINFHRTRVEPRNNNNNTLIGDNIHTYCLFRNNTVIPFDNINGAYNIENILCLDYNQQIPMSLVFINPIEIDIIRFIITYPWDIGINNYAGKIASISLYPQRFIGGNDSIYSYKGKQYKIHIGKKGGKYIIVNKKKIYIKVKKTIQ